MHTNTSHGLCIGISSLPTKYAMNAAIRIDRMADGPATCFTTWPIPMRTVIAIVELKPTLTKSNILKCNLCCSDKASAGLFVPFACAWFNDASISVEWNSQRIYRKPKESLATSTSFTRRSALFIVFYSIEIWFYHTQQTHKHTHSSTITACYWFERSEIPLLWIIRSSWHLLVTRF